MSYLEDARSARLPTRTGRILIAGSRIAALDIDDIAGANTGFIDTVEYETVAVRDDVVILLWQEHIGSTIVHVLDFASGQAHTAVTPAKGGFMRLTGRIKVKSRRVMRHAG